MYGRISKYRDVTIRSTPPRPDAGYRGAARGHERGTFRARQRFDVDAVTRAQIALFACGLAGAIWLTWYLAQRGSAVALTSFVAALVPVTLAFGVSIHRAVGARRDLALDGDTLRAWSGWGAPQGWEPVSVPIADVEAVGVTRFVPTWKVTRYANARTYPRRGGLLALLGVAMMFATAREETVAGAVCYAVFVRRRGAAPDDVAARIVLTHQFETPFDAEPLGRALATALGVPYEEHLGEPG